MPFLFAGMQSDYSRSGNDAENQDTGQIRIVVSMPPGEYREAVEKSFKQAFQEAFPGQVHVESKANWYNLVNELYLGHIPRMEEPLRYTHIIVFYRDHTDEMLRKVQGLRPGFVEDHRESFTRHQFTDPLEVGSYLAGNCQTLEGFPLMYIFGPSVLPDEQLQEVGIQAQLCPNPGLKPQPEALAGSLLPVIHGIFYNRALLQRKEMVNLGVVPSFEAISSSSLEVVVDGEGGEVSLENLFRDKYFDDKEKK